MKIILKNKELAPAINFLQSFNLKAADSRHRSKLVKLLVSAYEEFGKEEKELTGKFDLLNETGELKSEKDRNLENVKQFNAEQQILFNEKVTIEGGMYSKNIEELPRILNEYDGDLSGQEAEIYDRLLDEFEKSDAE